MGNHFNETKGIPDSFLISNVSHRTTNNFRKSRRSLLVPGLVVKLLYQK
jgi:hypothetical protein